MPKKDKFHETVKIALEKEQWNITNDPLFVPTKGGANFFIDLGAERIIGAEKDGETIAVEIKSFGGSSPMYTFYEILGQFLIYKMALREQAKLWDLFIAISDIGFKKLDDSPIFSKAMQEYQLKFVIINPTSQSVIEWKS
jgi:hypothetical protein